MGHFICSSCKSVISDQALATGKCPKCKAVIVLSGTATEGPDAMTMDVPLLDQPTGQQPLSGKQAPSGKQPKPGKPAKPGRQLKALKGKRGLTPPPTQVFGLDDLPKSVSIAPRKLSMDNVQHITNTWGGALSGDTGPRSSLKVDSQSASASGTGSSLVVNLRGVRSVEKDPQRRAGADYELLQVIGKGGMGVVYAARQASVDRMVAVKMIRPNVAANPERREKFLSEAVVTGDLDHPNIVPIYELGADEQDALFYSMKRVQGTPWSHAISQKTLLENIEVLMKVADAVAFAHANGVIHRDLKPENVMLGDFGEVLVMDWGLALATAQFRHSEFVTTADSMGGTPAYMAPEMVTGPFEVIGAPADIYLLGALLFEIVTGKRPHHGTSAQECLMAAARNEIQPTDKAGELLDICYKAMATEPADRFASVQDFQASIRDYHSHCESVALADRADSELLQASQTRDYQTFARALFGYQEAVTMWPGNSRARAGVSQAKLAYATCAKQRGDFDLGVSLLDASDPTQTPLLVELQAGKAERDARQKWLSRFKRIAAALLIVVMGTILTALVIVFNEKNKADIARQAAEESEAKAVSAAKSETAAKLEAQDSERDARKAEAAAKKAQVAEEAEKKKALAAQAEEAKQKQAALDAKAEEEKQKKVAVEAREEADLARQGEEQAGYGARIGMASAKIEENAFDTALNLLKECEPKNLRAWEWGYLKRLCDQAKSFEGSDGLIAAAAFDPSGKWFVTAGENGKAQIWDRATRNRLAAIDHGHHVHAVAISPDGSLVATAGADGLIRLSNPADGTLVRELKGHHGPVHAVAFPPDGTYLASAGRDRTVRLWEVATGRELTGSPLREHESRVWSVAFSPDGKRLASAGEDGKVFVWSFEPNSAQANSPALKRLRVFTGHQGPVFAAAFSPDGRYVASGGADKRLLVWPTDERREIDYRQRVSVSKPIEQDPSRPFEGHQAPIRAISFVAGSDGDHFVLSASDDNTVRIWDANTSLPRAALRGHSRPVLACAISPDGAQVVSGDQEGQIKLWNVADFKQAPHGRVLGGHEDAVLSVAFSPDGKHLATASRDHTALIHAADDVAAKALVLDEGHKFLATRAIYFDRGQRLLTAAGDHTLCLWNVETGTQQDTINGTGSAAAVAVSDDSKLVLACLREHTLGDPLNSPFGDEADRDNPCRIGLWQLNANHTHEPRKLANADFGRGHRGRVMAVAIAPGGKLLFSGDEAGVGILWDAVSGNLLFKLTDHAGGITDACFAPGGRKLLTASSDGTVISWDVNTGKGTLLAQSEPDAKRRTAYDVPIRAVAISPDGQRLLTLSDDAVLPADSRETQRQSVVRVWDVASGKRLHELYHGPQSISSIAFADAGQAAIVAGSLKAGDSSGGFVRKWNLANGQEVLVDGNPYLDLTHRREAVWSAVADPAEDGRVLVVGGNGAAVWNTRSPAADRLPEMTFRPHSGVTTIAFSADSQHAVTGSSDRRLKVWGVASGLTEFQLPAEHSAALTSATFSPADPNVLLTASLDGTARIWDLAERKVRTVLVHFDADQPASPVWQALFSADGRRVFTVGGDERLRIWDAASGKPAGNPVVFGSAALSMALSPNGKLLLVGLHNGDAKLLDAATGGELADFEGHTAPIHSVAFAPDGRRAVTGSADRLAKIWDTTPTEHKGKELLTLRHHDQAVQSVAFSPDGRTILTGSLDGTAVLWQTDNWNEDLP